MAEDKDKDTNLVEKGFEKGRPPRGPAYYTRDDYAKMIEKGESVFVGGQLVTSMDQLGSEGQLAEMLEAPDRVEQEADRLEVQIAAMEKEATRLRKSAEDMRKRQEKATAEAKKEEKAHETPKGHETPPPPRR